MQTEYSFKYGKDKINFSLDPETVMATLKLKDHPPLTDPRAAILEAIRNPIDSKPLCDLVHKGDTVAFLVNDSTRVANSHVFMPILLDELNAAGIPDKDMFIVFALGTHHDMTKTEMIEQVGQAVADRVLMYNSTAKDASQFVKVGTTSYGNEVYFNKRVVEADHIICTGSIVHHFFAGYGGGRKALFPGVAAYETIRRNHSLMLEPGSQLGQLDGNPVYEDQIEGTEMCRPTFLLNVVLNEKKEFLKIFAGDYITAHKQGCKFVESIYGTELVEQADLVIASCGGFPKDINVYQMQKTMDNAVLAVKEGGVIIILGECIEGTGSDMYETWMRQYKTPEAIEEKVRKEFVIGGHKAYAVTRLMKKAQFILLSSLDEELSRTLLFTPVKSMEEALSLAYGKLGPKPRTILMPQGSLTVPVIK